MQTADQRRRFADLVRSEKTRKLEDHYPWGEDYSFADTLTLRMSPATAKNLRISSVNTTSPGCNIYPNDCQGTNKPLCCKSNNGNDKYQCTDSVESCQPGPASSNACNTTLHHGDINETSSCLQDEGTVCCITTIGGGEHNRNCTANEIVSKNLWQVVSDKWQLLLSVHLTHRYSYNRRFVTCQQLCQQQRHDHHISLLWVQALNHPSVLQHLHNPLANLRTVHLIRPLPL